MATTFTSHDLSKLALLVNEMIEERILPEMSFNELYHQLEEGKLFETIATRRPGVKTQIGMFQQRFMMIELSKLSELQRRTELEAYGVSASGWHLLMALIIQGFQQKIWK